MSETKLVAQIRTQFGKGAARKIRRDNKIPAVMYGHGAEPVHITLPGHDTMMALKHVNALLTIEVDGKEELALAKDVQRDPIKPVIEHVDLVIVRRGEKVSVDVPVHVEGEAAPETVVTVDSQTLLLAVEATHIPENVVVSVEGLEAGTQIKAADVELPKGAELLTDPRSWSSTSRLRSPQRPWRPSSPRPRPRPASSTRLRRPRPPRPRLLPPRARPRARPARSRGRAGLSCRVLRGANHEGPGPSRTGPFGILAPHGHLARGRTRQPRTAVCRQPPQRGRDGHRRAHVPARRGSPQGPQGTGLRRRDEARDPVRRGAGPRAVLAVPRAT